MELPKEFKEQMIKRLGDEAEAFFKVFSLPPYKGVRVNTLKISPQEFAGIYPFVSGKVAWEKNGFYVDGEKHGKNALHAAGLFYIQEPSAMCAAPLLEVTQGEKVLDLCSAPGGKGTQLAQEMGGEGLIVLNEINYSRARILSQNVERMGVKNAIVTCASPAQLAEIFKGYFDKILVDAPCSGEGMFRKDAEAVTEWSEQAVKSCAARQSLILASAATMLKAGGRMVYSTCTFAREEDEGQIEDFLRQNGNFKLIKQELLLPHKVKGEGHFAALLEKCDGETATEPPLIKPTVKNGKQLAAYREFEKQTLKIKFERLHLVGDSLYSLPQEAVLLNVPVLRAGVHLGDFKGERFVPSHSLAMCLKREEVNSVEVDEKTAESYLAGNTFDCDGNGWLAVTYLGYILGWCKAVNGTAKNHYPKGLRQI